MEMQNVQLIILDCDGVLVDSEKLAQVKFIQLLNDIGIIIDEETCQKEFTGLTVEAIYTKLNTKFKQTFSVADMYALEDQIEQYLFSNVTPIPGVEKLLETIQTLKIPFCVASNSRPLRIINSLRTAGLLKYIPEVNIFSYTMVPNGKPAPDLFLYAANSFGFLPNNCVVIEDSFSGVKAANAAGIRSIAFFGGKHAQHAWYRTKVLEQNPTFACDAMEDIIQILK